MKHPCVPPSKYITFKLVYATAATRCLFSCQAFIDRSCKLIKILQIIKNEDFYHYHQPIKLRGANFLMCCLYACHCL